MIGNIYPETKWELARQGCFTSSEIYKLLSEPKSKADKKAGLLSDGATTYVNEKIAELLTGTIREFTSPSTEWGNDMEPKAIEELRKHYPDLIYFGNENKKFFPLTKSSGGSPDAVKTTHVFEIKCPENPANHIENLLLDVDSFAKTHKDYYAQLQMNMMAVAENEGLEFKDMVGVFVSYCPLMIHDGLVLKQIAVGPDFEMKAKIIAGIEKAEAQLKKVIQILTPIDYSKKIAEGKELRKAVNI